MVSSPPSMMANDEKPAGAERQREPAEPATPAAPATPSAANAQWLRAVPWLPFAVPALFLFYVSASRVVAKVGHAGATLDDAYIHFQYARAFAEGHPMRYHAGEAASSGATSLLWPAALAPFWLLGLRDARIVWAAWALSFAALGALAYEVFQLTRRLTGPQVAAGAGAMVFASSGLVWSAASGMEVVPLAWMIARTLRVASEWVEAPAAERTIRKRRELVLLAVLLPLLRPEGSLFSLFAAVTLARFPRTTDGRERARALPALLAPLVPGLIAWLTTGTMRSSTMTVKLLAGNPYYPADVLYARIAANVRVLVGTLLNGEVWSQEFLPAHAAALWMGGLVAIVAMGAQRRVRWRAAGVLLWALAMFVPCTYDTFLWNRLRYLWPFFPGWLVGAACASELLSELLAAVRARWKLTAPIFAGVFVGALAVHMDFALDDVAESASGIDRQQAELGRWAKRALPASARVGVNDTGAIAYFGERATFDVVGLTTPEEARYWVAGAGSRLEHYEVLARTTPARLPTHYVVYPEWMACDAVLGRFLTEAVVRDATILGGQSMRAFEADYSRLGTGELPWSLPGEPLDTLDVADLESEAAHGYALLGAAAGEQIARLGEAPDERAIVDGGRTRRTVERFVLRVPAAATALVARVESDIPARAKVAFDGSPAGALDVPGEGWSEVRLELPAAARGRDRVDVTLTSDVALTVFHYWVM
jgi:hypothetical protein